MSNGNGEYEKNHPLPEGWGWFGHENKWCARHEAGAVDGISNTAVLGFIGPHGIEISVVHHSFESVEIPWKVLLAVKDRAIAQAHNVAEELRARADDLRPEDSFVTGDRVRYVGDRSDTSPMRHPAIGAEGTVTGFSTPKHGYEHVKFQSVLVTWDEESPRPGIPIEGRETMVQSYELEAMEVH